MIGVMVGWLAGVLEYTTNLSLFILERFIKNWQDRVGEEIANFKLEHRVAY